MAFKVRFYSFAKKENSTAQPSGGTEYDCQIKRESGLINPEIILNIGLSGAPAGWNYAYIADFSRYYFIREWINEGPIWRAVMQCDVLASYKAAIGSSTLYALRSSHSYDGNIVDALYPCKADVTKRNYDLTQPPFLQNPSTGGVYVCGIVANNASTASTTAQVGSIKYYYLSLAGLARICDELLNTSNYDTTGYGFDPNDCSLELQKSLVDPLQYIKSCVWLPLDASTLNLTTGTIYINGWNVTNVEHAPVTTLIKSASVSINIPKHPDAASRGDYLNGPGYTQMYLNCPPYGMINLDTNITAYNSSITLGESIDVVSGIGVLQVISGGILIEQVKAMRGVSIQLSQITTDYIGAAAGAIGGIGGAIGAAMLGDIGGAIGSAVGGIANAAKSAFPKVSSTGGSGGTFLDNIYVWSLNVIFFRQVDDDNSHHGRPLCKNIVVSSYPGYLLIQDADIAINATAEELQKIRAYLEGGFYYE